MDQLIKEIHSYEDTDYAGETVKTIYFGGGTPSLLEPMQVEQIFSAIHEVFPVDMSEITFEMNPDDVTAKFLSALKNIGINRASMGVQSFQPELLDFMHRAHNRDEALRCIELLGKTGFDTYTVDLIYGNPGQSLEQLEQDLETLLGLIRPIFRPIR